MNVTVNPIEDEAFEAVPVGRDNALSARDIWKKLDCWAETTVRNKLNALVAHGRIKARRRDRAPSPEFTWLYWREVA